MTAAAGYKHNLKQYFTFSKKEFFQIIITALMAGFVLSFRKWGDGDTVNLIGGLENLILGVVFSLIALLTHVISVKLWAIRMNYKVDYSYYKFGLFIGFIITFISSGYIPLYFPGSIDGNVITKTRVGSYRPRFKKWEYAVVSLAAPLSNLFLVLLTKPFYMATGSPILKYFMFANLILIIYSVLPIPLFHGVKVIESGRTGYDFEGASIGMNVYLANRTGWFVLFATVVIYSILAFVGNFFSLLLSLLIAAILAIGFFTTFEK